MDSNPQPVQNLPAGFTPSLAGEGSFPVIPVELGLSNGEQIGATIMDPRPFAKELPEDSVLRGAMENILGAYTVAGKLPRPKSSNKIVGIIAAYHPGEPDWDAARARIAGLSAKSEKILTQEISQLRWRYQFCRPDRPWHGNLNTNGHPTLIAHLQADANKAITKFQKLSAGKLAPKDFNTLEIDSERVFVAGRMDAAIFLGGTGSLASMFVLYATGAFHAAGFQAASYNCV